MPSKEGCIHTISYLGTTEGKLSCQQCTRIVAALALVFMMLSPFPQASAQSATFPYLDSRLPIELRVNDLIGRMTLKEKIGQLNLPCGYVEALGKTAPEKLEAAKRFTAGTYTDEIGPGSGFFTLANTVQFDSIAQQVKYFNELQHIALTGTRLKIPLLEDEEGTHGAMFPGATVFPEGLSIGSTFDMPLVRSIYAAAAQEARSTGIHLLSTLVLEADRDPRMGRNMEAYTEDPYLYSRIAKNIVLGAQGADVSARDKVAAVMTDFPTQSEPISGMERGAIELSERYIRENFLPPWIAAFQAGALGVMAGYPEIDDIPEHASEKWNTEILRNELGFRGIVESEGNGFDSLIYQHIVPTQKEAGALALKAGVDMDITYEPAYMGPLLENIQEGRVSEALVDRALRRVLELKFRLGLFDHPYADVEEAERVVHSEEHQQLALRAARESIVLLKNDRDLLPLKKDVKSIAVIGPNADEGWSQLGDYAPSKVPQKVITVLNGIRQAVSPTTRVEYAHGCDVIGGPADFTEAIKAARRASVAVVVVGEHPDNAGKGTTPPTDGEAYDAASLNLTGAQEDMVKAIQGTGTPVVLVLINGRPLSIPWEAEHLAAIVEAWEPGEQGGKAIADVLFGDYNPTGRLAISVPRDAAQLPVYYNYKPSKDYWIHQGWSHDGGYVNMPGTALYPFGFGLSYTTFRYDNLRVAPQRIYSAGGATVTVDVTNTGSRPGVETVQLYLHEQYTPVAIPVKNLRGFERVALNPGQTKTVTMKLSADDLKLLDLEMRWRVVPGTFDVMIGKSSQDIVLRSTLDVQRDDQASGQ
ncbi:MAG TPA: glycoside hydrolase family 3 C-terminal domain-containing protein [Acidobacteriaceae bacterium]|nr:glycoside hydrolase family 3 C-terminal domain-containing protein [Acidobacteriaceae bacterium]